MPGNDSARTQTSGGQDESKSNRDGRTATEQAVHETWLHAPLVDAKTGFVAHSLLSHKVLPRYVSGYGALRLLLCLRHDFG